MPIGALNPVSCLVIMIAASWTIRGQSMTLGLQEIEYQHIGASGSGLASSSVQIRTLTILERT